jgi:hypothetical protein
MILVFSYILLVLVGSFMGLAESGDIERGEGNDYGSNKTRSNG